MIGFTGSTAYHQKAHLIQLLKEMRFFVMSIFSAESQAQRQSGTIPVTMPVSVQNAFGRFHRKAVASRRSIVVIAQPIP